MIRVTRDCYARILPSSPLIFYARSRGSRPLKQGGAARGSPSLALIGQVPMMSWSSMSRLAAQLARSTARAQTNL